MSEDARRIEAAFGGLDLIHSLYDRFPCGLRFALGGKAQAVSDPLPFLQAVDRARAILRALWPKPSTAALLIYMREDERDARAMHSETVASLASCGLDPRMFRHIGATPKTLHAADGAPYDSWLHIHFCEAPVDCDMADRALWGAIAAETPIRPKLESCAHPVFVDFGARIAAHVYDDRWMDVVAMEADSLRVLHRRYADWIFEDHVKLA